MNASPMSLTPEEVNRLLKDRTAAVRVEMTDKVGRAYNVDPLSPKEIKIAEQIFRLLLRDTEVRVRESLARHIKDSQIIPKDIVMTLARDVEEVALPILQYSEVLTDDDLSDLIAATEKVSRHLAISRRPKLSSAVSDTLLGKGNEEVLKSLVDNAGAEISEHHLNKIVEHYGDDGAMMEALTKRSYLPVTVVEKLVSVVSSSLSNALKHKYRLVPAEQIDKEIEKTRDQETLSLIKGAHAPEDIESLISQLDSAGRLNPSVILSALCQGNFEFFEAALARLSSIPVTNARKLITDRGELGFRAIYNKSGLPETMFPAVKLLLRIVRDLDTEGEKPGGARYANRIVERILHHSEDKHMENLSYIIALVRRVA